MSLSRWLRLLLLALAFLSAPYQAAAQAEDQKVVLVVARWEEHQSGTMLVIPFSDALTDKQKI